MVVYCSVGHLALGQVLNIGDLVRADEADALKEPNTKEQLC